jgi:hypothetical protein
MIAKPGAQRARLCAVVGDIEGPAWGGPGAAEIGAEHDGEHRREADRAARGKRDWNSSAPASRKLGSHETPRWREMDSNF